MAFAEPIVLANASAVNQNFVLQSRFKDGSDWIEDDATSTLTRRLSIRHSNAGPSVQKGFKPIRRHLVQMVEEKWNATLGKQEKVTLNLTVTVDPGSSVTVGEVYDLRAFMDSFLNNSNLDKLLRDET